MKILVYVPYTLIRLYITTTRKKISVRTIVTFMKSPRTWFNINVSGVPLLFFHNL